jgi:molybdenum cofactor cytidylyltransferase
VPTAAVVLAAGEGSRFGGERHKLLSELRGRPVVTQAVEAAQQAGIGPVIVVSGAVDLAGVVPDGVAVVHNPDWASGLASSLQVGISAAGAMGCEAVVVGLGDQPFLGPAAWQAVAACDSPIAAASFRGRRRNPVRLARQVWPLLPTSGDEGARALMRVRSDLVREVPCEGEPADIDTLEDLERWN